MRFSSESLRLSANEFTILRDLIRDRTGLQFDPSKRELLSEKLSGRAIECGFDAFIDYYYLLKYGPGADEEWRQVLNALSVPETYFWREMDQVKTLVEVLVPQYFARPRSEPLRIWSAACATGEEPLTIAMALNEAGWLYRAPIELLASDGSPAAIEKARQGKYRERAFRTLAPQLQAKYFTPADGAWQITPEIHGRIQWTTVNLMSPAEVTRQLPATVIFCRNVFIYFSGEAISHTVELFSKGISRPGYLFVGISESLLKYTSEFELQEIGAAFVYVKP